MISVRVRSHWCSWCFDRCYEGWHSRDGRFDPWSVEVTEEEIDAALTRQYWPHGSRDRNRVRYNIALGRHSGVRE